MFTNINKDNLFHAYLCEGGTSVLGGIKNFIEKELDMRVSGNPDVFVKEYESFGVGDSREISKLARLMPVGVRKIICFSAPSITTEAQNALLKLFEEPPEHTYFFVVLPSVQTMRPTLLSRVQILHLPTRGQRDSLTFRALEFLETDYAERIKIVEKITKDKDMAGALQLLNALEAELYEADGSYTLKKREGLRVIASARKYLGDKGSLLKQLLESVAIQLPMQKN